MHQITEQKQAKINRYARRNRQMHKYNSRTLEEVFLMYLDEKF